jgi:hypothetical protein
MRRIMRTNSLAHLSLALLLTAASLWPRGAAGFSLCSVNPRRCRSWRVLTAAGPLLGPRQRKHGASGLAMMASRKALCGLWAIRYTVEGQACEANVWLEESGNMRPVQVNKSDVEGGRPIISAGRWSIRQSSVVMYHRRMGELSHSWVGRLREVQLGPETANMSRRLSSVGAHERACRPRHPSTYLCRGQHPASSSHDLSPSQPLRSLGPSFLLISSSGDCRGSIHEGRIEQGDSDPEYVGSFQANQTLAAFSQEELLDEQLARQVGWVGVQVPACRMQTQR